MFESLLSIKKRYEEMQEQLNDPEVINDIKNYRKISMESNSVKDIVLTFNKFLIHKNAVDEGKEIISNEKDTDLIEMAKMQIDENEPLLDPLTEELKLLLLPKDQNDERNVIVEIRGAAGGDEANIFAGDLFDMYKKWAGLNDMKTTVLDTMRAESGGYTLIVFKIAGEKAYSKLKYESGVHRVQRVPVTETMGRVHTSTATVTVMPEADETVEIEINQSDLRIDTYRASGAGGQHVNTTDSAVRITHLPTGLTTQSQDGRSQISNKEIAMQMLKTKLYEVQVRKQQEESAAFRKLAGTGARAEKIRTYNYPQDRVTDHRISFSTSLKGVVDGKLNPIIEALLAEEQAEKIKEAGI